MTENIIIDKLTITGKSEWDSFLRSSPQGTLFNTFDWAEILQSVFGLHHEVLAATKNGSILAGIMIFYKTKLGQKIVTHAPLTAYNGPVFGEITDGEKSQKITEQQYELSNLLLCAIEKEYRFINISSSYNLNDSRPYLWRNWKVKPQYTYILNLEDKETIWDSFSSSLRRKIKHCETAGFTISESSNNHKLLELQEESYAKSGIKPVLPIASFEKFINAAKEKNIVDIYSISQGDDIHSMRAMLKWNNTVYDWIAGTDAQFKNSNATHYLLWELFKKYSADNYSYFDFMGANTKNITDFKRSFGGSLTEYFDLTYYSSSLVKLMIKIDRLRKRASRKQD